MATPTRWFSAVLRRSFTGAFLHKSASHGIAKGGRVAHCSKFQRIQNPARCLCSLHSTKVQRLPERRTICSAPENALLTQQSTDALEKVSHEIAAAGSRLFAVIYLNGHQYKVTTNDLVQIHGHIEPDVGERIRLEKVLLVGGDNFTLLGRPLLGLDKVRVEATVIEKTISQKYIRYLWAKRTGFKKYKEYLNNLTILRINSIEVSPNLK